MGVGGVEMTDRGEVCHTKEEDIQDHGPVSFVMSIFVEFFTSYPRIDVDDRCCYLLVRGLFY